MATTTMPVARPLRVGWGIPAVMVALVVLPGCAVIPLLAAGGGDDEETSSAAASDSADGATVTTLDDVESAVVRIVAEGSFVDPEQGELLNVAGSGSGFIIDSEGIAITNNHVVTGAALLDVFVSGEEQPRNARVLGVSECSDLAVIDIDGEGFAALQWNPAIPAVGSQVYAAGHPLGDSEFTLTNGIVSRASGPGETSWASVDSVLLHDATINPGNSGGPLVDADGTVVGVNYAGDPTTSQYFAISTEEALPLIDRLQAEEDLTTIGINGEAFVLDDGTSGIWVSSVDSGSPAGATGVIGGDIITRLENLVVGDDGTMSDYCDVLRSNAPDDLLAIEVLRTSTGEVLAGQINGDELVATQTFANDLQGQVPEAGDGASYSEYKEVTDATGAIVVSVPTDWDEVDGAGLVIDANTTIPAVTVSPDLATFDAGFTAPGALVAASSVLAVLTPDEVVDLFGAEAAAANCTPSGRVAYDDGLYTGTYELYGSCEGTETAVVVVAAKPADGSFMVIVAVQATNERDVVALDRIIDTFQVVGDV